MPTWTEIGEDTFTEGSDTNLESHTPTSAGTALSGWTHLPWARTASAVVESSNNTLTQPYHSGGAARENPYVISNACNDIQKAEGILGRGNSAILLQAQTDTTYWKGYAGIYNSGLNAMRILEIVNGGAASALATSPSVAGDYTVGTDVVVFEYDGTTLTLSWSGTGSGGTLTHNPASALTGGKPGVGPKKSFTFNGMPSIKVFHEVGGGGFQAAWARGSNSIIMSGVG